MKRLAWLCLTVLCSAILLNAQDKGNPVSGWVCDKKCVVQSADRTTCDPDCTERSGAAVFINEQGTVSKISNYEHCSPHMNKHVQAAFSPDQMIKSNKGQSKSDKEAQEDIRIEELREEAP